VVAVGRGSEFQTPVLADGFLAEAEVRPFLEGLESGALMDAAAGEYTANKTRSRQLDNRIEAGAIHAQSQAEYTTLPWWTIDERADLTPFSYLQPHFHIPRASAAGGQPWWVTAQ
jgi:hypothetical protein